LIAGCLPAKSRDINGFGLKTIAINLDSGLLSQLDASLFSKNSAAATVALDGQQRPAHVSYAGKSTADHLKKSFDIVFDDGLEPQSLRVSAGAKDRSALRTVLGFWVFEKIGLPVPRTEHVAVYFNKVYLGLYTLIEPVDEQFFLRRSLKAEQLFAAQLNKGDLLPSNSNRATIDESFKIEIGASGDFSELMMLSRALTELPADRQQLAGLVDIEGYLNFLAAAVVLDHWDGYNNNYFLYRLAGEKTYRFLSWDFDRIAEQTDRPLVRKDLYGAPTAFTAAIFSDPQSRRLFEGKLLNVMNHLASAAAIDAITSYYGTKIAAAYAHDRYLTAVGAGQEAERQRLVDSIKTWHAALAKLLTQPE
jgi:spore coat protein H